MDHSFTNGILQFHVRCINQQHVMSNCADWEVGKIWLRGSYFSRYSSHTRKNKSPVLCSITDQCCNLHETYYENAQTVLEYQKYQGVLSVHWSSLNSLEIIHVWSQKGNWWYTWQNEIQVIFIKTSYGQSEKNKKGAKTDDKKRD